MRDGAWTDVSREQVDTKEHGQMLNRILILEEERVPANNARGSKNRRAKKKGYQEGIQKIVGGIRSWRPHGPTRIMERKENLLREYRGTHEENFLSSWQWEDVKGEKAEMETLKEEAQQEESAGQNNHRNPPPSIRALIRRRQAGARLEPVPSDDGKAKKKQWSCSHTPTWR